MGGQRVWWARRKTAPLPPEISRTRKGPLHYGDCPEWSILGTILVGIGSRRMGWASGHIEKVRGGETISFRPRGHSMTGRIESGQLCTVAPIDPVTLEVGDIVLCRVRGNEYLHIVRAIQGGRY